MRFLGYGIAWIEFLDEPADVEGLTKSLMEYFGECRVVVGGSSTKRLLAILSNGHVPTRMELDQISPQEWEDLRMLADECDYDEVRDRVTMLEEHKP